MTKSFEEIYAEKKLVESEQLNEGLTSRFTKKTKIVMSDFDQWREISPQQYLQFAQMLSRANMISGQTGSVQINRRLANMEFVDAYDVTGVTELSNKSLREIAKKKFMDAGYRTPQEIEAHRAQQVQQQTPQQETLMNSVRYDISNMITEAKQSRAQRTAANQARLNQANRTGGRNTTAAPNPQASAPNPQASVPTQQTSAPANAQMTDEEAIAAANELFDPESLVMDEYRNGPPASQTTPAPQPELAAQTQTTPAPEVAPAPAPASQTTPAPAPQQELVNPVNNMVDQAQQTTSSNPVVQNAVNTANEAEAVVNNVDTSNVQTNPTPVPTPEAPAAPHSAPSPTPEVAPAPAPAPQQSGIGDRIRSAANQVVQNITSNVQGAAANVRAGAAINQQNRQRMSDIRQDVRNNGELLNDKTKLMHGVEYQVKYKTKDGVGGMVNKALNMVTGGKIALLNFKDTETGAEHFTLGYKGKLGKDFVLATAGNGTAATADMMSNMMRIQNDMRTNRLQAPTSGLTTPGTNQAMPTLGGNLQQQFSQGIPQGTPNVSSISPVQQTQHPAMDPAVAAMMSNPQQMQLFQQWVASQQQQQR